jgi:DNA polymerase III subunit gamma/tau
MSYQVFARKLRPAGFDALVGQEHVVRALVHALENERVHHAYLFTGTRGVGKTTIARILAKCLNCETGVTAQPCGNCSACREIAEGRFVDLIEVDAASRTKVDDTRDLLDNVQYLPARGRYKVYLIDEVHMLSGHSFNALLKTLEEPPPHVKFLLATTDPKKVPITVLSRCLQFQLKNLLPERIAGYLETVLGNESIPFEAAALQAIARAARGSMRDALSLTDQAIAYGGGRVDERDVVEMLGSVAIDDLEPLLDALVTGDAAAVLARCAAFAEQAVDFAESLSALLSLLHRIAVVQAVTSAESDDDAVARRFADRMTPETVQLFYQIVLLGLRDLALAPDPRCGFEMVMLRLLAFEPHVPDEANAPTTRRSTATHANGQEKVRKPPGDPPRNGPVAAARAPLAVDDWYRTSAELKLAGVARMLVEHSYPLERNGDHWVLCLDRRHDTLLNETQQRAIERSLTEHLGGAQYVKFVIGEPPAETPAARNVREQRQQHEQAVAALRGDANVQALMHEFGAELKLDSVRPIKRDRHGHDS